MTQRYSYAPHSGFVAPARARADLWRVAVVCLGFETAFLLSPFLVEALAPDQSAVQAFRASTTPIATLVHFFSFGITAVAFLFLVRLVHDRGMSSILGGAVIDQMVRVAIAVGIVLAVQEPVILWMDRNLIGEVRDIGQWAVWLIPGMAALLVQVSTEELFFRGYLQQQLAAWSSSRWVWMVVPSAAFGLAHYYNGIDHIQGVLWAYWAMLLGLACADLTARTGNLGAAIGLHLANNAFALLITSVKDWPGSGLALFLYPYQDPLDFAIPDASLFEPWVIFQMMLSSLSVFVMWMAARLTLRR